MPHPKMRPVPPLPVLYLVPPEGVEPSTDGLKVRYSTIELERLESRRQWPHHRST